jgi:hypothetical protein
LVVRQGYKGDLEQLDALLHWLTRLDPVLLSGMRADHA